MSAQVHVLFKIYCTTAFLSLACLAFFYSWTRQMLKGHDSFISQVFLEEYHIGVAVPKGT
jgi:hypothetical protein